MEEEGEGSRRRGEGEQEERWRRAGRSRRGGDRTVPNREDVLLPLDSSLASASLSSVLSLLEENHKSTKQYLKCGNAGCTHGQTRGHASKSAQNLNAGNYNIPQCQHAQSTERKK